MADYPETVEAAVRRLQEQVPDGEQAAIGAMAESELVNLQHGLGQWIRNYLGLWGANPVLLTATAEKAEDDVSDTIIRAFWVAMRASVPKFH